MKRQSILLTKCEIQSGLDRVRAAEGLILQLPATHEGRNTWLLNYGVREEAVALRERRDIKFYPMKRAAESRNEQIARQAVTQ